MSTHTTLAAASQERKARLAQLKSLKRKQPSEDSPSDPTSAIDAPPPKRRSVSPQPTDKNIETSTEPDATSRYLSGRNYDPSTRGPKLGYDSTPSDGPTLEAQAQALADRTRSEKEAEEAENKPLDLSKIQPRRPNWDLKRDLRKKIQESGLERKLERNLREIVRERVTGAQKAQEQTNGHSDNADGGGEANANGEGIGMRGEELVEATRELEREEAESRKREEEATAEDEGGVPL